MMIRRRESCTTITSLHYYYLYIGEIREREREPLTLLFLPLESRILIHFSHRRSHSSFRRKTLNEEMSEGAKRGTLRHHAITSQANCV